MSRESITISHRNDTWLLKQIQSEAFQSKSDVINHLIKIARKTTKNIETISDTQVKNKNSNVNANFGQSDNTKPTIEYDLKVDVV